MNFLIVDNHPIVISACRALLWKREPDVAIFEARSVCAAREIIIELEIDVFIIELNLPDESGLELIADITAANAMARVVVFTTLESPAVAAQALQNGAKAFVGKSDDPTNLNMAVDAVITDHSWVSQRLSQELALMKVQGHLSKDLLTAREIQILRHLAKGRNYREIARDTRLSYWTIAKACGALREKVNARTMSELVKVASGLKYI